MPPIPADRRLYAAVKREAKAKFKRWPSAYGSAWLSREYKRRGGTYAEAEGQKPPRDGVNRWFREQWIQVMPFLTTGRKVPCGARKDAAKACRPLVRIAEQTPITLPELLERHPRQKLMALARRKIDDMDGRLHWKRGKFYPSEDALTAAEATRSTRRASTR